MEKIKKQLISDEYGVSCFVLIKKEEEKTTTAKIRQTHFHFHLAFALFHQGTVTISHLKSNQLFLITC